MKLKITETDHWTNIELKPETIQEAAMLMRLTMNSLLEKPEIYLSFSKYNTDEAIYCSVSMKKRKPEKQFHSLSNRKK